MQHTQGSSSSVEDAAEINCPREKLRQSKRGDTHFLVSSPSVPTFRGTKHYSSTTITSVTVPRPATTTPGPVATPPAPARTTTGPGRWPAETLYWWLFWLLT